MKKKLSVKDELQAWAAGIGIVGGLFAFSLILGVLFMDEALSFRLFLYNLFIFQLVFHKIQKVFRTFSFANFPILNSPVWDLEIFPKLRAGHF